MSIVGRKRIINIRPKTRVTNSSNNLSSDNGFIADENNIRNELINKQNIYFRTSQSNFMKLKNFDQSMKKNPYYQQIETLIDEWNKLEPKPMRNNSMRRKLIIDKQSDNIELAIKSCLNSISNKVWKCSKNQSFIQNMKGIRNQGLTNYKTAKSIKRNMIKREIAVSSLGKRKFWKPKQYAPSKYVVLANSVEELNSLYKCDK